MLEPRRRRAASDRLSRQLAGWILGLGAVLPCSGAASAQQPPSEAAQEARTLFEKAVPLADKGKLAEACPMFAEAHTLFPTGGTAMQLARCREVDGQPREALALYEFVLAAPNAKDNPERYAVAQTRVAELKKKLEVEAGKDPGVAAEIAPASAPPPPPTAAGAGGSRVPAYVLLGVGAVGIGVGAVFSGLSFAQAGLVKDTCVENRCPPAQAGEADAAVTKGTIGVVAIGVGVAAAGVGAVLLLTSGKKTPTTAFYSPRQPLMVRF